MSTLQKYAESSNADLRAEAVMNTLQNKILKKAKPPSEKEQVIQELKQNNKAYSDELKAEANLGAVQKKMISQAKIDNPEFNTYQKLADRDRADLTFETQLKTKTDNATYFLHTLRATISFGQVFISNTSHVLCWVAIRLAGPFEARVVLHLS